MPGKNSDSVSQTNRVLRFRGSTPPPGLFNKWYYRFGAQRIAQVLGYFDIKFRYRIFARICLHECLEQLEVWHDVQQMLSCLPFLPSPLDFSAREERQNQVRAEKTSPGFHAHRSAMKLRLANKVLIDG